MGPIQPLMRVVVDTNVVVSALLFPGRRLAWLEAHWRSGDCVALISDGTIAEAHRVIGYPKFKLTEVVRKGFLAKYLPYCLHISFVTPSSLRCRDAKDQIFLDLCTSPPADVLVTGDADLLSLAHRAEFAVETPEAYRIRAGV